MPVFVAEQDPEKVKSYIQKDIDMLDQKFKNKNKRGLYIYL